MSVRIENLGTLNWSKLGTCVPLKPRDWAGGTSTSPREMGNISAGGAAAEEVRGHSRDLNVARRWPADSGQETCYKHRPSTP